MDVVCPTRKVLTSSTPTFEKILTPSNNRRMSTWSDFGDDDGKMLGLIVGDTLDPIDTLCINVNTLKSLLDVTRQRLLELGMPLAGEQAIAMLQPLQQAIRMEKTLLLDAMEANGQTDSDLENLIRPVSAFATDTPDVILARDTAPENGAYAVPACEDEKESDKLAREKWNRERAQATVELVGTIYAAMHEYKAIMMALTANESNQAAVSELEELCSMIPEPSDLQLGPRKNTAAKQLWRPNGPVNPDSTAPPPRIETTFRRSMALRSVLSSLAGMEGVLADPMSYIVPGGTKRTPAVNDSASGVDKATTTWHQSVRCTIVTTSLVAIATVVRAALKDPRLTVVRHQNRFSRQYSAEESGGYLDIQLVVLFPHDGQWAFGEVCVCLAQMLEISGRSEGMNVSDGLTISDFEQCLAAKVDPALCEYSCPWSDNVNARIENGSLRTVDLRGGLSRHQVLSLSTALVSTSCAVTKLVYVPDIASNSRLK